MKNNLGLLFIVISILYSCSTTEQSNYDVNHYNVNHNIPFSNLEYEIYSDILPDIFHDLNTIDNGNAEDKNKVERKELTDEDIKLLAELLMSAYAEKSENSGYKINVAAIVYVVNDDTKFVFFNKNNDIEKKVEAERTELLSSFGEDNIDLVNDLLKKNLHGYSLNVLFERDKEFIAISNNNEEYKKANYSLKDTDADDNFTVGHTFLGEYDISRVGINRKQNLALMQIGYKGQIYFYLLEKIENWKIKKGLVR